jgi:sterol desaturase/sphingolipid hydroxylase (fatty acid hydroxylase superfamily)
MTIYNKSGFVWGIIWTILGVARLALLVIVPEDSTAQLIKGLVLGIFMLILGVTMFRRAFSKQATREDRIEQRDERNKLVTLKAQARTSTVLLWTIVVFMAAGFVGYMVTNNVAWAFVFTVPAVFLIVYMFSIIGLTIYYEHRE